MVGNGSFSGNQFRVRSHQVQQSTQSPPKTENINEIQAKLLGSGSKSDKLKSDLLTLSAMKKELDRIDAPHESKQQPINSGIGIMQTPQSTKKRSYNMVFSNEEREQAAVGFHKSMKLNNGQANPRYMSAFTNKLSQYASALDKSIRKPGEDDSDDDEAQHVSVDNDNNDYDHVDKATSISNKLMRIRKLKRCE